MTNEIIFKSRFLFLEPAYVFYSIAGCVTHLYGWKLMGLFIEA